MKLLKYVKIGQGRNGQPSYWYFRRNGRYWRLPGEPGTVEFAGEYQRLLATTATQPRALKPVKPSARGYIYFLKAGARWKIGFSTKPAERLDALKTGLPYRVEAFFAVTGYQRHERKLHSRLAVSRREGEWFSDCPQLRKLVLVIVGRGTDWLDEWTETNTIQV